MTMEKSIGILHLCIFTVYFVCPSTSVNCQNKTKCTIRGDVTDCSYQNLSCIPCDIQTSVMIISFNFIKTLSSDDFGCLKNVKSLDLSNNQITDMTSFRNEGLSNLQSLDLSNNKIHTIDNKSFKGLSNLLNLKLRSNSITSLNAGVFEELTSLQTLDLGNNSISILAKEMFEGVSNLQTLKLTRNKVQALGINAFGNIVRLKTLRIDHNKLSELNTQPFNNLKKLQSLDLSYNDIKRIEKNCFSNCSKLEVLKLNDNLLSSFTGDVFADTVFPELQSLHLSNNMILTLTTTSFNGIKNVHYLHLDNNYISQIQDNTFIDLRRLEFLYLQHNNLVNLSEHTFRGLLRIQDLDISFNNVQALQSNIFNDNSALKTLSIRKNKIHYVGNTTFSPLIYLNALYAEGNKIESVMAVNFGLLSRLKILYLDDNVIKLVEETALSGLTSLVKLYLRSNNLKTFPSEIFPRLKLLSTVDLRENEITSFSSPAINQSFNLLLEGNPFSCDCRMTSLKQWLSNSGSKLQSIICNQPERVRGKNIFNLQSEKFQCIAPSFDKISRDMRVEVGEDVNLFCTVDGFPKPVLRWFDVKNSEIGTQQYSERFEIDSNGNLYIKNVSLIDAGQYTCVASNPGGRIEGKIQLDVVEKKGSKAGVIGGGLFALILVVGVGVGLYMYLWSYKRKRDVVNETDEANADQPYMSIFIEGFPTNRREGGSQGSIHSEVVYATIGAGITGGENKHKNDKEEHGYQPIWKPPVIRINEENNEKEQMRKAPRSRKPGSPGYMTMLPTSSDNGDERDLLSSSSTLGSNKFIKNNVRKTVSARFESRFPTKPKDKLQSELKAISKVSTLRKNCEDAIQSTDKDKSKPKPLYAVPEGNIKRHVQQLESKIKKKEDPSAGTDKSCTMPRLRVDSAGNRAMEPITVGSRPRTGSASKIEFSNKMYDSVVK
ncbi:uncharacterized protein [Antedon mediterranea]|uniref:uncharacterized protein n=1 Tax=Antedon mediterranea TaxID=105859 RepID=UPI003AF7D01A